MCIKPRILFNRFDFSHGYRFVGLIFFKVVVVVVVVGSIIIFLNCFFGGWGNTFKVVLHVCFSVWPVIFLGFTLTGNVMVV